MLFFCVYITDNLITVLTGKELERAVQEARRGSQEAMAKLYDAFVEKVYTYVYYRVGNHSEAEDLTEDIFVKMAEKIKNFKGKGHAFISWLFIIAKNSVTSYYRKKVRRETFTLSEISESIITSESAEDEFLKDEGNKQLYEGILQLTEEQQQIILLRFFSNLSTSDVSKIVGKSQGAVKALQHRALISLFKKLRKPMKGEE